MDFSESSHGFISDSSGPTAQMLLDMSKEMMQAQLPDQPELWEKLTPTYKPGCKRMISSDDYFPTIAQDNVTLETRPIHSIAGRAVNVVSEASGQPVPAEDDYDLLVCATGFKTVDFMHPIHLRGRNSRSISDVWSGGAKAYYGISVEDMPNFAMLYGPNTNLGHSSIILMIEAQSRYINGLISPVLDARRNGGGMSLTIKKDKLEEFNEVIQKELRASAFDDANCRSWYKTESGLITNNWSRTVVEYQKGVEVVDFGVYEVEGSGAKLDKMKVGRVREETAVSDRALMLLGAVSGAAAVAGWMWKNSKYLSSVRVR